MNIFTLMGTILVDNTRANESISRTGKESETLASKLGTGLKVAGGIAAGALLSIGTAAGAMAVKGVKNADELKKSINGLQVQTGATENEIKNMEDSLLRIYGNNFGEGFEDIASSMASVKQQTKLTGQALEETTTNALIMRDSFEMEVGESVRAVDMMMKQFGITSEEAYNLIAQGAQAGLDKNQNLLDSVNEYSVHFKQLGFDSEEMFNIFANGAETGVFDIDKLGDAMKEFGIRSKDASKGTVEAYASLGLNADDLTNKFSVGGEQAQEAFSQVTDALLNMDNKVIQNQIGVALFGTMWEDMGVDAIAAITNVNGEFDKTASTLDSINKIKYNSFGEALSGIGRMIETNFTLPLGKKLIPILTDMAQWIYSNMPQIQAAVDKSFDVIGQVVSAVIQGVSQVKPVFQQILDSLIDNMPTIQAIIEEVFGAISEAVSFATKNFNVLAPILTGVVAGFLAFQTAMSIIGIFKSIQTATEGVTLAQAALNAVMAMNPIALIVAAIAALVVALGVLWLTNEDFRNFVMGCWEGIKTIFADAFESIKGTIEVLFAAIRSFWEEWGPAITLYIQGIWDFITLIFDTAFKLISDIFNIWAALFKGDWEGVWNGIKQLFSDVWDGITALFEIWWDTIINVVDAIWEKLKIAFTATWEKAKEGIISVWNSVEKWFKEAIKTPIKTITDKATEFLSAGRGIIQNVWDGMVEIWDNLTSWVEEKTSWLLDKLMFWRDSQSEMNSGSDANGVDGSHANGLDYVPFDGYKAILHKGEGVLTAEENRARSGQQGNATINQYFYNVSEKDTAFKTQRAAKKALRELALS